MAIALALLLWLCLVLPVWAQPAVTAACSNTAINAASLSASCTISGSNRALVGGVVVDDDPTSITTFTFGGVPLSPVANGSVPVSGVGTLQLWMYHLPAPALGTQTLEVTMTNFPDIGVGAVAFSGVDQAMPLGTAVVSTGTTQTTAAVNVPSAPNQLIVDLVGWGFSDCSPAGFAVGPNQTVRFDEEVSFIGAGPSGWLAMSTELHTGSPTTMSWTCAAMDAWVSIGVPVLPTTAGTAAPRRRVTSLETLP